MKGFIKFLIFGLTLVFCSLSTACGKEMTEKELAAEKKNVEKYLSDKYDKDFEVEINQFYGKTSDISDINIETWQVTRTAKDSDGIEFNIIYTRETSDSPKKYKDNYCVQYNMYHFSDYIIETANEELLTVANKNEYKVFTGDNIEKALLSPYQKGALFNNSTELFETNKQAMKFFKQHATPDMYFETTATSLDANSVYNFMSEIKNDLKYSKIRVHIKINGKQHNFTEDSTIEDIEKSFEN